MTDDNDNVDVVDVTDDDDDAMTEISFDAVQLLRRLEAEWHQPGKEIWFQTFHQYRTAIVSLELFDLYIIAMTWVYIKPFQISELSRHNYFTVSC